MLFLFWNIQIKYPDVRIKNTATDLFNSVFNDTEINDPIKKPIIEKNAFLYMLFVFIILLPFLWLVHFLLFAVLFQIQLS